MSESKKIEVIIIENNYVVHHTTSQVYPDANVYSVVMQAMIESLTDASGRTPVKHISGSSNGRTTDFESVNLGSSPRPESKPVPANLFDAPITPERQEQARKEAADIIAKQRKENEESLKNIKQIERDAYKQANAIRMSDVLGGTK